MIIDALGKPYEFPSRPPKSFDCYTITEYVRQKMFGLQTPVKNLTVSDNYGSYNELMQPVDGCIVTMTEGHVGVYVEGKVITALDKRGVCALDWKVANAVYQLRYWEYRS